MQTSTKSARGLVVAAVAFDGQTETVVQTALSLAKRFDMDLRFVNVVEPIFLQPWVMAMSPYYAAYPLGAAIDDEFKEKNEAKLKTLLAGIKPPRNLSGEVLLGLTNPTLIADCQNKRANLVITAYNPDSYKLTAAGVSTALGMMHEAPLPVMAVTKGFAPDFNKPGFKLLVADDLQEYTQEAVRKAYELASGLQGCHLRHVHVHGDFREAFREKWEGMRGRFSGAEQVDLSAETIWMNEYEARVTKAREQAAPFYKKAEMAHVRIELDVRAARNVADELYKVANDAEPDLLMFGRHRVLRTRPFLIGRMPLRTMLQMRRPVVIVPPVSELYARLPFPAAGN